MDGKLLPVGGCSKVAGASYGRAAGHLASGYKPHAIGSNRAVPEAWEVAPPCGCEKAAAGG